MCSLEALLSGQLEHPAASIEIAYRYGGIIGVINESLRPTG